MKSGAVAQLGECSVRNAEVIGSIPIGSTLREKVLTYKSNRSGLVVSNKLVLYLLEISLEIEKHAVCNTFLFHFRYIISIG